MGGREGGRKKERKKERRKKGVVVMHTIWEC
jgi:hypothetical protein